MGPRRIGFQESFLMVFIPRILINLRLFFVSQRYHFGTLIKNGGAGRNRTDSPLQRNWPLFRTVPNRLSGVEPAHVLPQLSGARHGKDSGYDCPLWRNMRHTKRGRLP